MIVQPNTISNDTVISSGVGKKKDYILTEFHHRNDSREHSKNIILAVQQQQQTKHKETKKIAVSSNHLFFLLGQFDHSIVFCFLFFKFDAVVIWVIDIINLLDNLFTLFAYQFLKGQKEKSKM